MSQGKKLFEGTTLVYTVFVGILKVFQLQTVVRIEGDMNQLKNALFVNAVQRGIRPNISSSFISEYLLPLNYIPKSKAYIASDYSFDYQP